MTDTLEYFIEQANLLLDHSETRMYDSHDENRINHDSYRNIVAQGDEVLPYLQGIFAEYRELETLPERVWFLATSDILGEKGRVPKEIRGMMNKLAEHRYNLLTENGYVATPEQRERLSSLIRERED